MFQVCYFGVDPKFNITARDRGNNSSKIVEILPAILEKCSLDIALPILLYTCQKV